jgi:FixJ family two-component response regulator
VNDPGEIVYIVDDDECIRESITGLLETQNLTVIAFESAMCFLSHRREDTAGCLLLDLQLPGMSGLELQEQLLHTSSLPIVFISGRGDVSSSVRAMKGGALEFLTKPIDCDALIATVRIAFVRDRENRQHQAELDELQHRVSLLSPREREALPLIVSGLLNKQSAAMLGITEVTLQIHRGQIMRKMAAPSFADLVRMCGALGIPRSLPGAAHCRAASEIPHAHPPPWPLAIPPARRVQ